MNLRYLNYVNGEVLFHGNTSATEPMPQIGWLITFVRKCWVVKGIVYHITNGFIDVMLEFSSDL